ncbi:hypothetical protein JXQ70_14815, partial [bacterium]|nr:hypothetical protein [bacterium]
VVRAINGTCYANSNSMAGTDAKGTPGAPVITAVNDLDACASTGVSIVFTAGSGAASHNLWVDGSQAVVGITSPYTYVPGDANSHSYVVRAINGTCYADSNSVAGTDANNTPGAPVITAVNDLDVCASTGVSIVFTAGSGASSHNLWVDGSEAVVGITSPYTYVPGDANSHSYVVRAINGTCYADSTAVAGTDVNGTPSTPVITNIYDPDINNFSGLVIEYTPGSPATSHDLWMDGGLLMTGFNSGDTTLPGDGNPHSYVIRAWNNTCWADSTAVLGTDQGGTQPVPPEITPISWTNKTTLSWTAVPEATSYNLYRGVRANLPALLTSSTDFCTRWTGSTTSVTTITETATVGDCYYFLVTGENTSGEGTSGYATAGERILDTTGTCP